MGRHPIGKTAMSGAERVRRHRQLAEQREHEQQQRRNDLIAEFGGDPRQWPMRFCATATP
jgi:hypothetical protein